MKLQTKRNNAKVAMNRFFAFESNLIYIDLRREDNDKVRLKTDFKIRKFSTQSKIEITLMLIINE